MEVCCTFKALVGGVCGSDCRDRKHEVQVVPLQSCTKDIVNHLATWSFSGPESEIELILSRAAIFKMPDSLGSMTIWPLHRGKLGLGWTRGSTRCRIPDALSNHGKGKKNVWPKGDRGLGKQDSEKVLQKTGVFIAVGSGKIVYNIFIHASILIYNTNSLLLCLALLGICRSCRNKMKTIESTSPTEAVDELEAQLKTARLQVGKLSTAS